MDIKLKELLISKQHVIEEMYNNTLKQTKAINKKNEKLLITLINKRQKMIEKVDKIDKNLIKIDDCINDEYEIKIIKQSIQSKIKEIFKVNQENYEQGKQYFEEIKELIKKTKVAKKATLNGYLKKSKLAHGYYIDKKVGY